MLTRGAYFVFGPMESGRPAPTALAKFIDSQIPPSIASRARRWSTMRNWYLASY